MLGEANQHYIFQNYDEAIKILKDVISKMPELPEPLITLANIYGKVNK